MHILKYVLKLTMSKYPQDSILFREVDGVWRRVDSQEPNPPTLAEFIDKLGIVIDENAQFVRIVQYLSHSKVTIEYRTYGGTIRINILSEKI